MTTMSKKKNIIEDRPSDVSGWVECVSPNNNLTKGKKYKVMGCHTYLNRYGSKGDYYYMYDQFLTLKNDYCWTVKVRATRFRETESPMSRDKQDRRIRELEARIYNSNKKNMEHFHKNVNDIINGDYCPLPLEVIPNYMGINLCSVESIEWDKLDDGQIDKLTINFIPKVKEG